MLRNEAGLLVGYVSVDLVPERDLGELREGGPQAKLEGARATAASSSRLECTSSGAGNTRSCRRMRDADAACSCRWRSRSSLLLLWLAVPANVTEVLIVLLSIPFALVGSVWLLYLLDYRLLDRRVGRDASRSSGWPRRRAW